MVGENGRSTGSAENTGGVLGFISSIHHSLTNAASEVFEQSVDQVKAVPKFTRSLFSAPETRLIAKNIGIIATTDVLPIIAVNAAMVSLESYINSQGFDPSFAMDLGLTLAKSATYLITFRQTTQALTRIAIVQAKQSSVFDEATKDSRNKVDSEICCHDCSSTRFIKGNIRAPLVYMAQQSVIYALRNTLGDMATISNFDLIVDSYSSLVIGQLIMDYRLANDGLCERHQHEYSKQFWERVLTLGLPVVILRKIIAEVISAYTGVDKNLYGSMIETFTSIAMVGLVHHMTFPKPVSESSRYLNPVSFVRAGTAYVMDKVDKDLINYAKDVFSGEGKAVNYYLLYKGVKGKYTSPLVQIPLTIFLPYMYLDAHNFVNDPVMRDYWPVLMKGCLDVLNEIENLQAKVSYHKVSRLVSKDVQVAFKPLTDWVKPIYDELVGIFEHYMLNPLLALGLKNSAENIEKLVAHLRSDVFNHFIKEIKDDLAYLNVDVNRQGFIDGCQDSLSTFAYLNYVIPKRKFSLKNVEVIEECYKQPETQLVRSIEQKTTLDTSILINAIIQGIRNYNNFVEKNFSSNFNSVSALFSTTITTVVGGDPRGFGKIRAFYYLKLLEAKQPENYKLLVAFSILKNNAGSDLSHKIGKSLNQSLPSAYKTKEIDHCYTSLRQEVADIFYEQFYESLSLSDEPKAKRHFFLQVQPCVNFLIQQSNVGINICSIPQQVDDWYTNLDKLIKKENHKEDDMNNCRANVIN